MVWVWCVGERGGVALPRVTQVKSRTCHVSRTQLLHISLSRESGVVREEERCPEGCTEPSSMEAHPPPAKRPCPADHSGIPADSLEEAVSVGNGCISAGGDAPSAGGPEKEAAGGLDVEKAEATPAKFKKFGKRKKFAVLLSYSGRGYMGMQK